MGNMLQYIREEDELRARFVSHAFQENPNIKDLGDFQDALFSAFDSGNGQRASRLFDDEVIMELFDSQENKNKISGNISSHEFQRIFDEREGITMPQRQEEITIQPQRLKVKSYNRDGSEVRSYEKTFRKWSTAEAKFLSIRKNKKLSPKQIVREYNAHFKDNPRTSTSIKMKVHRL